MNKTEIKCPKCGEVFSVDETNYAQIGKAGKGHRVPGGDQAA